jgi:hypothetical protein
MRLLLLAAAGSLLASTAPAFAQAADPGPKINQLIIYGEEACPPSTDEEIVVCHKLPAEEQFRIPENLRGDDDPEGRSWADRATELQYVGRTGIGSCSPAGPGGATGCFEQLIRQARAERAGADQVNWNALIEEARKQRLSRIDEDAEAVEDELNPRPVP